MTIPDGYKLVPVQPTPAMIGAYKTAMKRYINTLDPEHRKRLAKSVSGGIFLGNTIKAVIRYKAMVEAAPEVVQP